MFRHKTILTEIRHLDLLACRPENADKETIEDNVLMERNFKERNTVLSQDIEMMVKSHN